MREYTTREVADLAGLPESRVRGWTRAGLLNPIRGRNGRYHYSFQDLALLRTAAKLLDSGLTANRVGRALRRIRQQIPDGRPLSAVRIFVAGKKVVVKDRLASWEPESRQGMLDFDVQEISGNVAPGLADPAAAVSAEQSATADDLYEAGIDLELAGREDEARRAYHAALKKDPALAGARINLGRLLHADKQLKEAEQHYRAVLAQDPANPLASFNLGVALEDRGDTDAAIAAYRRTLDIDEDYADAHFNLSRLLEARGDEWGALRHLSRFKRLIESER